MQLALYQQIAMVTHGNAFLHKSGGGIDAANSAFDFQEYVRFADLELRGETLVEHLVAEDPSAWLAQLKARGCTGLRLGHFPVNTPGAPDRIFSTFANAGGLWVIEAVFGAKSDLWTPNWLIGDHGHPEQKIWRVVYGRTMREGKSLKQGSVSSSTLSLVLADVLETAIAFTSEHMDGNLVETFEKSLAILEGKQEPNLGGLAPEGLLQTTEARLLAAARDAWVFGGMGSWNDYGFDGKVQKTYDEISAELHRLLFESFRASANSSYAATTG